MEKKSVLQAKARQGCAGLGEKEGEVERLGVRRQETGEQRSLSECKRDKKERRKSPTQTAEGRQWESETGGKERGGGVTLRGHTKHNIEIVGVSKCKIKKKHASSLVNRRETLYKCFYGFLVG